MPISTHRRPVQRTLLGLAAATLGLAISSLPAAAVTPAASYPARSSDNGAASSDRTQTQPPGAAPDGTTISLALVKSGFSNPVFVTNAGDKRLFVVEQPGYVRILRPPKGALDWRVDPTPFLDIHTRVLCCGEQGLLGLAFHPDFRDNGRFFVYYTTGSGNNVVVEGQRTSYNHGIYKRTILTILHPGESNHNGGMIAFGPDDGYLYISTGDGGGGGDIHNHAQTKGSLLGKLLRINVNPTSGYGIPSTNPYVGLGGNARLVWSFGLRNPWRWSFDSVTHKLWVGDVGQEKYEEIDRSSTGRGVNFGWHVLEGRHCYNPSSGCSTSGKTPPLIEYPHAATGSDNCAVIGGYVYHGSLYPAIANQYFFGDACSGRVWHISADANSPASTPAATGTGRSISGFGVDKNGELFLVDLGGGIYRVRGT